MAQTNEENGWFTLRMEAIARPVLKTSFNPSKILYSISARVFGFAAQKRADVR